MENVLDDPIRIERMAEGFERMTRNIERLTKSVVEGGRRFNKAAEEADDAANALFEDIDRGTEQTKRKWVSFEADWISSARRIGRELKENLTFKPLDLSGGAAGAMAGVTGPRGIGAVLNQARMNIVRDLPMGGLLGLMVYGKTKELEYESAGQRVARVFDKVGGVGRAAVSSLAAQVRSFAVDLGSSGEEISASASAFAEYSMAEEVFGRAKIAVDRFGGSILATATATDQYFKIASGSTAKLIGEVYQSTGLAAREAADETFRLAIAAEKTDTNYEQLASTMLSGVSALRLQRQGVDDLAASYVRVRAGLAAGGLRGANNAAVNAGAMRGVSAVAGGLGGLSQGLKAVLGEEMSGGRLTGLDAVIGFEEGMAGGRGAGVGDAMRALRRRILPSMGSGRSEQITGLMGVAPGLGFEGARAVVDMKEDALADALKDPQTKLLDEMKGQNKTLAQGFSRQFAEESPFNKTMREIRDGVARIGGGLLTVTTVGLMAMTTSIQAMVPSLKVALAGIFGRDVTLSADEQALIRESVLAARAMDKGGAEMSGGLEEIFGAGKGLGNALSPELMSFLQARAQRADGSAPAGVATSYTPQAATEPRVQAIARGFYSQIGGTDTLSPAQNAMLNAAIEGEARHQLNANPSAKDAKVIRDIIDHVVARFQWIVDSDPGIGIKLVVQKQGSGSMVQTSPGAP